MLDRLEPSRAEVSVGLKESILEPGHREGQECSKSHIIEDWRVQTYRGGLWGLANGDCRPSPRLMLFVLVGPHTPVYFV